MSPAGQRRTSLRTRSIVLSAGVAIAVALFGLPSAAGSSSGVTVDTFPQDLPPQTASGLLATGDGVWFQTYDDSGAGTSHLGLIGGDGTVQSAGTPGSGYDYQPPVETTDGNVWIATDPGGAVVTAPAGVALAGVDPATFALTATASTGNAQNGWQTAADASGRFQYPSIGRYTSASTPSVVGPTHTSPTSPGGRTLSSSSQITTLGAASCSAN